MALTDRQRATVAYVLARADPSRKWKLPWNDELCDEMEDGGHPLKVTGERWEEPESCVLRHEARHRNVQHPTWLTATEIAERHGTIAPGTTPVEVVFHGRPTLLYNVGQVASLPSTLARRYWEIHPFNAHHRHPDFERFVSTLDVPVRHSVKKPKKGPRLAYLPPERAIRSPPFEMFYTAADYCLSLTHELVHWAGDVTGRAKPERINSDSEKARQELIAEFGAVFACDEMRVPGDPRGSPIEYIAHWRHRGRLGDTEVFNAAETAAALAAWLRRIAPGWRASEGGPGWHGPKDEPSSRTTRPPEDTPPPDPRLATLKAASQARQLVAGAEALGKMDPGHDPDAWRLRAIRILESARQIDLTIPAVEAAIEAAVALETPLDATPVTAAIWLKGVQERTMRILAMRDLTRSASQTAETTTFTRSIRP